MLWVCSSRARAIPESRNSWSLSIVGSFSMIRRPPRCRGSIRPRECCHVPREGLLRLLGQGSLIETALENGLDTLEGCRLRGQGAGAGPEAGPEAAAGGTGSRESPPPRLPSRAGLPGPAHQALQPPRSKERHTIPRKGACLIRSGPTPEIGGRGQPKQVAAPKRFTWPRSGETARGPRPKKVGHLGLR